MDLNNISTKYIVDKFNTWLDRTTCKALREHRQTGVYVVEKLQIPESALGSRPNTLYETKIYIETLQTILPPEESLYESNAGWVFNIHRDLKKWSLITEMLSTEDYEDMTVDNLTEYMVKYPEKIMELYSILEDMNYTGENNG